MTSFGMEIVFVCFCCVIFNVFFRKRKENDFSARPHDATIEEIEDLRQKYQDLEDLHAFLHLF
jgi:hypothetical protein